MPGNLSSKYPYKGVAKISGEYHGSVKDIEDGYIHFSEEGQIRFTLDRYFKNKKNLFY